MSYPIPGSNQEISLHLLNLGLDDSHLKHLSIFVSCYYFSCSNKRRWIQIFKPTGCRLKIVFSVHSDEESKREERKILSPLEKELDGKKREFFLHQKNELLMETVPFGRQNYILKDHFQLIWLLCSLNFKN